MVHEIVDAGESEIYGRLKTEVRADIGLELEICRAGQQAGRKLRQDFYVDSYHNVKVIYFTQNLLI